MRTVYVNGAYVPENEARVSIFDRGLLFGDGIYEVSSVVGGKLVDFEGHWQRLQRSMTELGMACDLERDAIYGMHEELVRLNVIDEGLVYLQVTRGSAGDRDFPYHQLDIPKTVFAFTQEKSHLENRQIETGQKVKLLEDLRWKRCDIKTVQLLYACMAKSQAMAEGYDDAWLHRDGVILEGASNNAWIVTHDGALVTRHLSNDILAGITRQTALKCAELLQLKLEIRAFSVEEAKASKEAFLTSASNFVSPVVQLDEAVIGDGRPGPVTLRLREMYIREVTKLAE